MSQLLASVVCESGWQGELSAPLRPAVSGDMGWMTRDPEKAKESHGFDHGTVEHPIGPAVM